MSTKPSNMQLEHQNTQRNNVWDLHRSDAKLNLQSHESQMEIIIKWKYITSQSKCLNQINKEKSGENQTCSTKDSESSQEKKMQNSGKIPTCKCLTYKSNIVDR